MQKKPQEKDRFWIWFLLIVIYIVVGVMLYPMTDFSTDHLNWQAKAFLLFYGLPFFAFFIYMQMQYKREREDPNYRGGFVDMDGG